MFQDNQLKLKLYGGKKKVKIIQGNILASNGLLHILDRAMDKVAPTFESNTEVRTSGKSDVKSNPSSLVP